MNEDDVVFEELDESGEESLPSSVAKLKEKNQEITREKAEYLWLATRPGWIMRTGRKK